MIKAYLINGKTYAFKEGTQPAGAVEFKPKTTKVVEEKAAEKPANKAAKPAANKKKKAATK